MNLFDRPKKLFGAKKLKDDWYKQYIGRTVVIDGEKIEIKSIAGNKFNVKMAEINGSHLINFLRFFAQMNHVKDISEEEFVLFEQMDVRAYKPPQEGTQNGQEASKPPTGLDGPH